MGTTPLLLLLLLALFSGLSKGQINGDGHSVDSSNADAIASLRASVDSRLKTLTDEHLLASFALVKDLLSLDLHPKEVVAHLRAGTAPTLTSSQLEKLKGTKDLALRSAGIDPCIQDIVLVCVDVLSMALTLLGITTRIQVDIDALGMTPDQARRLAGIISSIGASGASVFDRAMGVWSLLSGLYGTVGPANLVYAMINNLHLSGWEVARTLIVFTAQLLVWFGSDGLGFIGEVSFLVAGHISLVQDALAVAHDCFSSPTTLPTLPPVPPLTDLTVGFGGQHIFIVGESFVAEHRYQNQDLTWSAWAPLGGEVPLLELAVARNADGSLEAFGVGLDDNALYHTRQALDSPGTWGPWSSLGGWISTLAVGTTGDGRLEVFAAGKGGRAYHIRQDAPNSPTWGNWDTLSDPTPLSELSVSHNQDGQFQVFGISTDGNLYSTRADAYGPAGWAPYWVNLGGWNTVGTLASLLVGEKLQVYITSGMSDVFFGMQKAPNTDAWTDWQPPCGMKANQLTAVQLQNGDSMLFAVGLDLIVYYQILGPNGEHAECKDQGWWSLGGYVSSIAAIMAEGKTIKVFGVFLGDRNVQVIQQLDPSDPHSWGTWTPLK